MKTRKEDFFCFDEGATGTGTPVPSGGAVAQPSPSSSAPEPTPAATPGSAPGSDASPAQSSDPFSGLDGNFDSDLDEVILPGAPPTDGGAPAPSAAPAATPATPAASPAPAATPPATPAVATPAAEPTATSLASPRAQLDEAVEGFKTNSAALSDWAGQNLFKLSDEDAAALVTNAETVIPRLMGQVYTQALAAAGNLIRNFTPMMIDHAIEQQHTSRTKSAEAVDEFYKTNPDLNEKDHGELVSSWAKAFRAANPKATRTEAIAYVAQAVRIQKGMAAPAAQAAPAARTPPFAPARPGGRSPQAPTENDPYSGLGQEFDD